jgi:hypothetical protein
MSTNLSTLKMRVAAILSTLTLALVSAAVSAQMPAPRSQVDVPFEFQVGSSHLTAGRYVISNPERILLFVQGAKHSALTLSMREQNSTPVKVGKVVFHRYGNQYFLREVWMAGASERIDCPQSHAEQEARRTRNGDKRASLPTPTNVELAFLESPR